MVTCAICEESFAPEQLNRLHGLDVCDRCRAAPADRVGPWATVEIEEEWAWVRTGGGDSSTYCQIVTAKARGQVPLPKAWFGRESLGWLTRLFKREVQVGDPLFDDTVWVGTEDHDAAARLLANDGVQSAILDAVTMPADLRLEGTEARLRAQSVAGHPPGECGVLVLAILRHARDMAG